MDKQVTIDLARGFTDSTGNTHTRLTFGKRLTGGDVIRADERSESSSPLGFECAMYAAALVEFGTLSRGEFLHALLSLKSLERADVQAAYLRFMAESSEGREGARLSDDTVRLGYGLRRGDVVYTDITFGRLLTGYDELRADNENLTGVARRCFLIGLEVVKIASEDGAHVVEGGLTLEDFERIDGDDLPILREAEGHWYDSLRAAHVKERNDQPAELAQVN
jgi:hypothetical protein